MCVCMCMCVILYVYCVMFVACTCTCMYVVWVLCLPVLCVCNEFTVEFNIIIGKLFNVIFSLLISSS